MLLLGNKINGWKIFGVWIKKKWFIGISIVLSDDTGSAEEILKDE